ncbi:neuropeptide GPCR A44 [Sarcoptes scabiei]|nr:neuropeptide GPCR A44 [Sarcoptes scabiei]
MLSNRNRNLFHLWLLSPFSRPLSLFAALIILIHPIQCVPKMSTMSTSTTTIATHKCQASLLPKTSVVHQLRASSLSSSMWSNDGQILFKCSASMTQESFSHPVFDISFGDTSNTGLYILRGLAKCSSNNTYCESEFRIPTLALKQLLSTPAFGAVSRASSQDLNSSKSMNHLHQQHPSTPSIIKVVCDVADTSSQSKSPVRCSESTTIQFAKVLGYNESCSLMVETEECDRNMLCVSKDGNGLRCQCKKSFINTVLDDDEDNYYETHQQSMMLGVDQQDQQKRKRIVCLETALVNQKCLTDDQCRAKDPDTRCQFVDQLGYRICQCLKDYRLISNNQNERKCMKIADLVDSKEISVMDEATFNYRQMSQSVTEIPEHSSHNQSNELLEKLSLFGMIGSLLMLLAIIIIAISIIRFVFRFNLPFFSSKRAFRFECYSSK